MIRYRERAIEKLGYLIDPPPADGGLLDLMVAMSPSKRVAHVEHFVPPTSGLYLQYPLGLAKR